MLRITTQPAVPLQVFNINISRVKATTCNLTFIALALSAVSPAVAQDAAISRLPLTTTAGKSVHKRRSGDQALPGEKITPQQRSALASYGRDIEVVFNDQEVPSSLVGDLMRRTHPSDAVADAQATLQAAGPAFRLRPDDGFTLNGIETEKDGTQTVRMTQTYRGIPVIGGELSISVGQDYVTGISGRFVSDLNVLGSSSMNPGDAAERALLFARNHNYQNPLVAGTGEKSIYIDHEHAGHVAVPVQIASDDPDGAHTDNVLVDAMSGNVLSTQRLPLAAPPPNPNYLRNPQFELGDNGDWFVQHNVCGTPGNPTEQPCQLTPPPNIIVAGDRVSCGLMICGFQQPSSGQYLAWLNGYGEYTIDILSQVVAVPSDATTGTLSFYLRVDTKETTTTQKYDVLVVQVRDSKGAGLMSSPTVYSNLDAANPGYVQHTLTFDASKVRGQKITVFFQGQEDYSNRTSFLIDNTYLSFAHAF
jgi:hypothetical protein